MKVINCKEISFFCAMALILCFKFSNAQKPILDANVCKTWASVGGVKLSDDGKYLMYDIDNVPLGSRTLVIKSTNGKWEKSIPDFSTAGFFFLADSKYVIGKNSKDSLIKITLGKSKTEYFSGIKTFQLLPKEDGEWLCYVPSGKLNDLVLRNLKNNKEQHYSDLKAWMLSDDSSILLLQKEISKAPLMQTLNWVNLKNGRDTRVWKGDQLNNLVFDSKHQQLSFKTNDSILYFKFANKAISCIATSNNPEIESGLSLGNIDHFSKDGKRLFLYLSEVETSKSIPKVVEIWTYRDVKLQTEQEKQSMPKDYLAVLDLASKRVSRLQYINDSAPSFPISETASDSIGLISTKGRIEEEWNQGSKVSWSLVFTNTGKRKRVNDLDNAQVSFSGKYLIYFNDKALNWFSYEISTGKVRNLTEDLTPSWGTIFRADASKKVVPRGIAGWLVNDDAVLIYDQNDIWKLDPLNKMKPINLTNGYGKANAIVFNLAFAEYSNKGLTQEDKLYLSAFNLDNKNNGFYRKELNKIGNPQLLIMGPYIFNTNSDYVPPGSDFTPLKAKKAESYLVRRMSSTEAPNYFNTKDFKTFTRLTDIQPQKKFNWYTTELHTWKSLDGRSLQGVLYKPENFDPNKKYPIIFHFYERKSDGLNAYIRPEPLCGMCNINISTYVSNGYLVFTPDIYYKIGDPMQGTYDAVVSAANYMSGLSFVNVKKMGIQGCSFGGIQTNYLVTHTDLFAAAVSSSGLSNLVSAYGGLINKIKSSQSFSENGQLRMGANLWERPDYYIKNSPIFQVDKVVTPLLIMHTKNDGICMYSDAIQFFTGLRRMGKKAWMLAYSDGNHGLNGIEADDFSIRMMQFFDYYLKDKPAPVWMLDGVFAKNRSWKAGLELDRIGRTPGPGLLTKAEQEKVDSLKTRKPIMITLK